MTQVLSFLGENIFPLILLVVGSGLLVLEMFIPGFGLPGISGAICVIAGVIAMAETVLQGLLILLAEIALLCVVFSIVIHSTAKGKITNSRLVLNSVATEAEKDNALSFYEGKTGVTVTRLNPVGVGEFEGVRLNILSGDAFIEAGQQVKVVKVEGKRIYVRLMDK